MPTVDILGAPHAYELLRSPTDSSAETLVFIHGWLLSQAYWQPLVSALLPSHCCLTYDMRGFGDSIHRHHEAVEGTLEARLPASSVSSVSLQAKSRCVSLPSQYAWQPKESVEKECVEKVREGKKASVYKASAFSLAAYAQDLGELLDRLGLDRVWLVGHSLGGSVALWAAYLLPERVKGVICLNAGGGIYIPKEFEKFRAAGQQMVKFRPPWLAELPLLPRVFTRAMVHKPLEIRWGQQRLRDFVQADGTAAKGALLESTTCDEVHQLPQLIGQLRQPVRFITASQDTIMPPRYVHYLASFHPQFEAVEMVAEIPDCGHMSMVEQPQAVAAAVLKALSSALPSV
ncbi:MAG: 2-succinyl-6-hydroxy-2,4-cyclohexadiene-1-carboxylate synthase MenH [Phormidesmis priestleyi Ana]|uniref:2-succinyl-6-hydroxy-2, 4-cyclohexadiene-1-carboxylate synthase MenH n=1 Tax=Phormidesmis priestleyi Ana TaxID=1666911 RepID=A0A0P7YWD8_9CYAN|nr:MAG: 2-succinyl-6-hydroxy-2,4-cyclohexadiene-1-carboxylate synthase MenH [Phormidesmis priestleyi Ana]